jgi:hypothetical protein
VVRVVSRRQKKAADEGPLVINAVVYAEISVRFERIEELESYSRRVALTIVPFRVEPRFSPARSFCDTAVLVGGRLCRCPIF